MNENIASQQEELIMEETVSLRQYLESIDNDYLVFSLLCTFVKSPIFEIRQACVKRIRVLLGFDYRLQKRDADKLESVIKRLFAMSISNKFAKELLDLYIFAKHRDDVTIERAIEFALALMDNYTSGYLLLDDISKAVCSRLHDYCPNECYDRGEIKKSIFEVLPEVKEMLQNIFDGAIGYSLLTPTVSHPHKCLNFCNVERALKLVVLYRHHDQSFLPVIENLIKMHRERLLIFGGVLRKHSFESAKNVAVLKEAAKLLRQAQREAPKAQ